MNKFLKRVIIVIGPPRSGTSLTSNVISELGVNFGNPNNFVDAKKNKHNPIFFELQELNLINEEIFAYSNKKWTNFDWLPTNTEFSEDFISRFEERIKSFIIGEFGNSPLIGMKDPRFCFTLPIWMAILARLGYQIDIVNCKRNPNSIFTSNAKINKNFSSAANFKIVAESILASSFLCAKYHVVTVDYDKLVDEPQKNVEELCRSLHLSSLMVNKACSVISSVLRNNISNEEFLYEYFKYLSNPIVNLGEEYIRFREIAFATTYDLETVIEEKNEVVLQRDGQIGKLSQTVLAKDNYINYLNLKNNDTNNQLLALQIEQNTFGAKIGRSLTKIRHFFAPVGSYRGNFLTLIIKTILSISNLGLKLTIKK